MDTLQIIDCQADSHCPRAFLRIVGQFFCYRADFLYQESGAIAAASRTDSNLIDVDYHSLSLAVPFMSLVDASCLQCPSSSTPRAQALALHQMRATTTMISRNTLYRRRIDQTVRQQMMSSHRYSGLPTFNRFRVASPYSALMLMHPPTVQNLRMTSQARWEVSM